MAIVQISQITNRKGRAENLPQLAGAELGWSTDTRQLYIGNGTIQDGAPVIGNTEILTEFSDILALNNTYTYQGAAAGYTAQTGATPGTPIIQGLQSWLDQFASVKDFGATGDGVTDDTAAINRALYQLYCREVNPQIRRSLFFPAGVYRVTGSINIPSYATLYGEGNNNSLIVLDDGINDYVARSADSLQHTGANIGNAGAAPPKYVTISNMGFSRLGLTGTVFLVEDASNYRFQNVGFRGPATTGNLVSSANDSIGLAFASTNALVCEQITLDGCVFSGLTWGVNNNQQTKAVTICNSEFRTLYQGIVLGTASTTNGGSTGTRIVSNMFDAIYAEGIVFGANLGLGINASGHNIFYDVGNHFTGSAGTPATSIVRIESNNNVSISDLFERTNDFATTYPRVVLYNTQSIATTNGEQLTMGTYTRTSGQQAILVNDSAGTVTTFSATQITVAQINYGITRNNVYRTGTIMIATNNVASGLTWSDDYVDNGDTGIALAVDQTGTTVALTYTSSNTGLVGQISYSITYLV